VTRSDASNEFAERVAALFREALAVPNAERPQFVAAKAAGDTALLAEVERLLAQKPTEAALAADVVRVGARIGAYVIEARIGAGGMGEVFRALDTRLDRRVAIKVSPSRFGERFEREAKALSALNHPNVCTLFDVGPNYLVMELVEGETLAARLERGVLPLADAVRYGAQIADALAEAHHAGIVHRDLKPQNVMLTRRGVKVLDFGIAKFTQEDSLTRTGAIIGTAAYLAPEQLAGEPATACSDIYALGVLLHEMLAGRRPAPGMPSVVKGAVGARSSSASREAAAALDALVARLLEPDPARRPASAMEVAEQLQAMTIGTPARIWHRHWIPAAIGVAAVAAALAWWLSQQREAPTTAAVAAQTGTSSTALSPATPQATPVSVASVAVMPFANRTGEPDKDYFAEGMAEELINALTKVPDLKVASRTSSFAYRGKDNDVRAIAKELGVATVIEGSVRSAGDRIRLTAQLTNAESGYQVWSETYDRNFKDLFELQDDLTRQIVAAFRRTLSVDPAGLIRPTRPTTTNLDAYILYMRAIHAADSYSTADTRKGIEYLKQAVALDPNFAHALGLLALTISNLPETPLAEVERYARRAHELDPTVGNDALISADARRGDWLKAEELFRALPTDNIDPTTYTYHATSVLWPTGKVQDAQREYARTIELAPAVPGAFSNVARIDATLGREAESVRLAARAAELGQDVSTWQTREIYYHNALYAGRHEEAGRIAVDLLPPGLRTPEGQSAVRLVHAAIDDAAQRSAAIEALTGLIARTTRADVVAKSFALGWYSRLGALDEAYALAESLRKDFGDQAPTRAWAWLWYPEMAAFRRDARFQPFVTLLGMMPYWEKYGPPDSCGLDQGRLRCQ
jgi:serine/threonine protein kinase